MVKSGGSYCAAVNCTNRVYKNPSLHFYRFPRDEARCKIWVQNTRSNNLREKTTAQLAKNYKLCNEHFEPSQFTCSEMSRLNWNAIPTLFSVPNPPPRITVKRKLPTKCDIIPRKSPKTELSNKFTYQEGPAETIEQSVSSASHQTSATQTQDPGQYSQHIDDDTSHPLLAMPTMKENSERKELVPFDEGYPTHKSKVIVARIPTKYVQEELFKPHRNLKIGLKALATYKSFKDIKEDFDVLPEQWVLLEETETSVTFGFVIGTNLDITVTIGTDLLTHVKVFGFPVPHMTKKLEYMRLTSFLDTICQQRICVGITDKDLQKHAKLPSKTATYFRHVTYINDGDMSYESTVRSVNCKLLINGRTDSCQPCLSIKPALMRKRDSRRVTRHKTLSEDSLDTMSDEKSLLNNSAKT